MPEQTYAVSVKAKRRYVRVSPQKARLVARVIKGRPAVEALNMLLMMRQKPARFYAKLLKQAIGNAVNDYELSKDKLVVFDAIADEGPKFKRVRPRARGRVYLVGKKMSHLSVVVVEKEE